MIKFSTIQTESFFNKVNTKIAEAEFAFERIVQAKNDFEGNKIKKNKLLGVFAKEDENIEEILEDLAKILAG